MNLNMHFINKETFRDFLKDLPKISHHQSILMM